MTNTELLQRRFKSLVEARAGAKSRNIKEWEIFLQDCIEDSLTDEMKKKAPCWWQHTDKDIFILLMGCKDSQDLAKLIEDIANSLHE